MALFRSVRTRIKLRRLLAVTVLFTFIGIVDSLFVHFTTQNEFFQQTELYSFPVFFITNSLAFLFTGLCGGALLIFVLKDRIRNVPFPWALTIHSVIIFFATLAINLAIYIMQSALVLNKHIFHPEVLEMAEQIFSSPVAVKNLAFGVILFVMTIVGLRVNDKYGIGMWPKLLLGKYYRPTEEERVFMFVDIKSSTTIAEELGHIQYHNLLNDFFKVITDPVIYSEGEIYQYVGDEVIVTWPIKKGVRHANCINCFFWMQNAVAEKSRIFYRKYGLVPEFKAGVHTGIVTTGEIGLIKRDIVYSGDVLNTTSRIQQQCNPLGVKLLFSEKLMSKLMMPPHLYITKKVGEIHLKGKSETVVLFTV